METIDQLALVLSLGVTTIAAVACLAWSLWRLLSGKAEAAICVRQCFRGVLGGSLVSGSVLFGVLVWIVGALELRSYHHHYAVFVWFLAFLANTVLGAVLAFLGALLLERLSPDSTELDT